jgi:hypothetical protein
MLDDDLREQLAEWVRPVTTLPVPAIRVLRRRARRRGIRRTAAAAAITAVVAAVAVAVTTSMPGAGALATRRGASPASGSPSSWSSAPGTWYRGAWQPAGPALPADASPADAPYIVLPWNRAGVQVRDVFTGTHVAYVAPPAGQYLFAAAGAGDDRTFVIAAEVGGRDQGVGGPPIGSDTVAFDELRLGPGGQPESLRVVLSIPMSGSMNFAISQDASMLAYTLPNGGFETVSLAAGTGRSWTASHAGAVGAYSLSWAGDRTLAFEWAPAENPHPAGIGIRLLNVAAAGTLLGASRLVVPYRRYCAANSGGGWGCLGDPVLTPDGSKVMVAKGTRQGSVYTDSVVEYSTQTGQALASVAPPVRSQFPGTLCVPLWTDPSGAQVVSLCGHPEKYDHGRVTPITLHQPMYGTDVMAFGWQPGSLGS